MVTYVRSLRRGLQVLQALNEADGADATTVADRVQLSRGTTHRILETLVIEGFLTHDLMTGKYWLRPQVHTLSDGCTVEDWIANIAEPKMITLSNRVTWPISLTKPAQTDMVVLAKTDNVSPFKFQPIHIGHRVPMMESAAGLVYLACIENNQLNHYLNLLKQTQPAAQSSHIGLGRRALGHLKNIREKGYCLIESTPKVFALAVPIQVRNSVVGCVSLRVFSSAMTQAQIKHRYLDQLNKLTKDISKGVALVDIYASNS